MWKILAIIAAVVLAGAAYLGGVSNKKMIKEKIDDLKRESDTLAARERDLKETVSAIAMLESEILQLEDETEQLSAKKIDLDNQKTVTEAEIASIEARLKSKQDELDRQKIILTSLKEIEDLRRRMVERRTQIEESEINITKKEGTNEAAEIENKRLNQAANELGALRADQNRGIIRGDFESSVTKAFNNWGFVVIAGGNDQGVVHNAQLDVYRRGQYLCKLLVRQVEGKESVADIVPGSLQPGQTVQPGDMVRKAIKTVTPAGSMPVGPPPVPAGGAAPAPVPAAPAAPQPQPADPFGSPAADPFGGGMENSAPKPPDPFGAPAADPFGSN